MTLFASVPIIRYRKGLWLVMLTFVAGVSRIEAADRHTDPPDFFAGMTAEEYRDAGLDRLTVEQRQALNDWLARHLRLLEQPASTQVEPVSDIEAEIEKRVAERLAQENVDRLGKENRQERKPVSARIAGPFKGWRGATEFVLDNGQVWRQVDGGTYFIRTIHDPEVELVPMALGSWGLRLKSTGRTVKVRRVR